MDVCNKMMINYGIRMFIFSLNHHFIDMRVARDRVIMRFYGI
jgi:hypothetical protein